MAARHVRDEELARLRDPKGDTQGIRREQPAPQAAVKEAASSMSRHFAPVTLRCQGNTPEYNQTPASSLAAAAGH